MEFLDELRELLIKYDAVVVRSASKHDLAFILFDGENETQYIFNEECSSNDIIRKRYEVNKKS